MYGNDEVKVIFSIVFIVYAVKGGACAMRLSFFERRRGNRESRGFKHTHYHKTRQEQQKGDINILSGRCLPASMPVLYTTEVSVYGIPSNGAMYGSTVVAPHTV